MPLLGLYYTFFFSFVVGVDFRGVAVVFGRRPFVHLFVAGVPCTAPCDVIRRIPPSRQRPYLRRAP